MNKSIVTLILTLLAFTGLRAADAWLTNFDAAIAQAKKEHKLVLADFNGSDFCAGCKALRKIVFDSEEFRKFAAKNLVLLDVDFPMRKEQSAELRKHNEALSNKFKVDGFPTVLLIDANGREVGRVENYDDEPPNDYINKLKKLLKK